MVQKEKLDLTKDRIGSVILAFVLPLMLGSLIQQLYTMTDAVIVGRFAGKMGLAAIDSVHTLFKFPINFMNGLAAGATILISSAFGAKNARQTRQSVQSSIAVAVVLGVVASVGGVLLSPLAAAAAVCSAGYLRANTDLYPYLFRRPVVYGPV